MKIGFTELMIVFLVALFVIGPDNLPEYARKLGEALGAFKKASDSATKEIRKSIVEPLEEAQKPLKEAMEPLNEINRALNSNVKDVQKSLNNIGKSKPEEKTESAQTEEGKEEISEAAAAQTESIVETAAFAEEKAAEETSADGLEEV